MRLSDPCLDCHRDRKAPAEHKVDIVPATEVKGLPLAEGMMTYYTWHDPQSLPSTEEPNLSMLSRMIFRLSFSGDPVHRDRRRSHRSWCF